ncbi:MAG TPA: hypothetical protein VMF64_13465 [Steroidobacteraceae bacterium]|nr:hypothetical protein [Steroidobacteraceae bacterium]
MGNMQPGHSAALDGVIGAGAPSAAGVVSISAMAAISHAHAGAAAAGAAAAVGAAAAADVVPVRLAVRVPELLAFQSMQGLVIGRVVMRISLPPDRMAGGVMQPSGTANHPR